jgi:hypothetical protein
MIDFLSSSIKSFLQPLFSWIRGFYENKFSKWRGVIRRFFLNRFRKEYVKNQMGLRKGECKQCGRCCQLAFRCPFLTKAGKCLIYHKGRPMSCITFPIDRRDLDDVGSGCGYFF